MKTTEALILTILPPYRAYCIIQQIRSLENTLKLWAGFDPISKKEAADHAAKHKRDYEQSKTEKEAEDVAKTRQIAKSIGLLI